MREGGEKKKPCVRVGGLGKYFVCVRGWVGKKCCVREGAKHEICEGGWESTRCRLVGRTVGWQKGRVWQRVGGKNCNM